MSVATTYRTCPRSGLQFEEQAEKLIKANAFVGVVWLLIGGILAIGVVLTRWPAVHWLQAEKFYMVLTAHGIDMLIFWIIFFEVAVLYFASSTLLRCRLATPRIAWLAFALMVIGSVVNNVAVFRGASSVMMTSYVPMMAEPAFYLGLILFAVGALIACFVFFGTLVVAKRDKTYEGSVPLVTFGAITAAIIAVFTISSGAIILIPTWLKSLGVIQEVDALVYRTVWWALGCLRNDRFWREGEDRMLERVVISRRTSEQELDLLMLLEEEWPDADRKRPVLDVHNSEDQELGEAVDWEMLDAVSEWLSTMKHKVGGHDKFQLAVARNALGIVKRQLLGSAWDLTFDEGRSTCLLNGEFKITDLDLPTQRRRVLDKVRMDSPKYPALKVVCENWPLVDWETYRQLEQD